MSGAALAERLRRCSDRRAPLWADPDTTAFRLVNAEGDGVPGVTVDWFDGVAVASLYEERSPAEEGELLDAVARAFAPRSVFLKRRPKEARVVATTHKGELAPEVAARGEDVQQLEVRELGLRYLIRPGQGLSVGLYLDGREPRRWVRDHSGGRQVLNCFAYTCGFGIAAAAGGAARAVNVDLSRRVLDWGAENARRNSQRPAKEDFIAGDVFEWLRRLSRRGERFGLAVLDPPSFSTSPSGKFSARSDYPALVEAASAVLAEQALLLACCNLATLEPRRFEDQVSSALARAGRRAQRVERLGASSLDFPSPPGRPPPLKVLAVEVR